MVRTRWMDWLIWSLLRLAVRSLFGIFAALALAGGFAVSASHGQASRAPEFKSAELVSATGVVIPFNSVANGIVALNATIGKTGSVEEVEVTHELASMTEHAADAAKNWKFTPAMLDGKPVTSRVAVFVLVCPPAGGMPALQLPGTIPDPDADKPGVPPPSRLPGVIAAEYPPNATLIGGTVVLQAVISANGDMDYTKAVKDIPGLTLGALKSVNENWKFSPAMLDGKPIRSVIVLAVAFRPPVATDTD